jgi:hypothetical protein
MYNTSLSGDYVTPTGELAPNVQRTLPYVDLSMFVNTEPDDNGACWIYLQGFAYPIAENDRYVREMRFDITEDDAAGIVVALQEYLAKRAQQKEERA